MDLLLNVVLMEESEDQPGMSNVEGITESMEYPSHWGCDCANCVHQDGVNHDSVGEVMVVTRSKKEETKKNTEKKDEAVDPLQWQVQKDIRQGVVDEIQKIQGVHEPPPLVPISPSQKITSLPIFQESFFDAGVLPEQSV